MGVLCTQVLAPCVGCNVHYMFLGAHRKRVDGSVGSK